MGLSDCICDPGFRESPAARRLQKQRVLEGHIRLPRLQRQLEKGGYKLAPLFPSASILSCMQQRHAIALH